MGKSEVAFLLEQAEQQTRNAAFLAKEAAYATPGTKENNAYHRKLDEIHALALKIRADNNRAAPRAHNR